MNITIAPASLDKADSFWRALDAVARERRYLLFLEAPPIETTREFMAAVIAKGWSQFFALHEGEVIGWCDVLRHEREGLRHSGHLGIGLLPPWRGMKVGARLLAAALDDAFRKGLTRLELEVYAANTRARALYRKFGFVEEGRKRQARYLDGAYEDSILMALLKTNRGFPE